MVVQGDVAVFIEVGVVFDEVAGVVNYVGEPRFARNECHRFVDKVHNECVFVRNVDVAELDQSVQIVGVVVFAGGEQAEHLFHKSDVCVFDHFVAVELDVAVHVFEADLVGGFDASDVDFFNAERTEVGGCVGDFADDGQDFVDFGFEESRIEVVFDGGRLFEFGESEEGMVFVEADIGVDISVADELENLALVVGHGGLDGFPFGFGEFLLFDSVHF